MSSPFPRAALWVIGTTCVFEPFVALGVLAVLGFEHADWALGMIVPLAGLKLLGAVAGLGLLLGPARAFAQLPPSEQARQPKAAAAALEAVLQTPVRFPLIQGALWSLHYLSVGLVYAARGDVSPKYYAVAGALCGALLFGAYAFAHCLMAWLLTPWAGRVSRFVTDELDFSQATRGSLARRLLPLAGCLTLAPAFAFAVPGFAQHIERGISRARDDAQKIVAALARAPGEPPPPGGFLLDRQGHLLAGDLAPSPPLGRWFEAVRAETPEATQIDARAEQVLSYRVVGDRVVGAVATAPTSWTFLGVLSIYALVMMSWSLICSITLTRSIAGPLGQLATALDAMRLRGALPEQIEVSAAGEIGRVAISARETLGALRVIHGELMERLSDTVTELGRIAREQTGFVEQQAASLAQAAATSHEIRQTSALAAEKTRMVLAVASEADELGSSGTASVNASLDSLGEISAQAATIAARIGGLDEQAMRVSEIVETVKELADQSNILALNAGLEAAKAGEAARGFAVVAQEMRSLAHRSLEATSRIRQLVADVQQSIRESVAITEGGRASMEGSMSQIRASGESLRALADRLREVGLAVRHIGASVADQDAGIGQIVQAVQGLDRSMQASVAGIRATQRSADSIRDLAARFAEVSRSLRT